MDLARADLAKRYASELYRKWLSLNNFVERSQQLEMISSIIDGFASHEKIGFLEAGTGTGKTIAYVVAALGARASYDKPPKIVIVTSTVALQDQLVNTELKDLSQLTDLNYVVRKGRTRYVCPYRLRKEAKETTLLENSSRSSLRYRSLLHHFEQGTWEGDISQSPVPDLSSKDVRPVTTDALGCLRTRCSAFDECPYYKVLENSRTADVIVTNYDVLLTDLKNESATVSYPNETIYVFDEAHNFLNKTMNQFSARVNLKTAVDSIKAANEQVAHAARLTSREQELRPNPSEFAKLAERGIEATEQLALLLGALEYSRDNQVRFALGNVTGIPAKALTDLANPLQALSSDLENLLHKVQDAMAEEDDFISVADATGIQPELAETAADLATAHHIVSDWLRSNEGHNEVRAARWLSKGNNDEITLHTTELDVATLLRTKIWQPCANALCISATLGSNAGITNTRDDLGINGTVTPLRIPSPFDLNRVQARVVSIGEPVYANKQKRTHAVIAQLTEAALGESRTGLVLFTSRDAISRTKEQLSATFLSKCLFQSEFNSTNLLLRAHRARVKQGQQSYLLGLDSLREGVDLPGELCQQVVVTRLPFPVPSEPVLKTREEFARADLDLTNYDCFNRFSVDVAALKLAQACGRLIRNETDSGILTILDDRTHYSANGSRSKYGPRVLGGLPRYRWDLVDWRDRIRSN